MRNPFARGNRLRLIVGLVVAFTVSQAVSGRPVFALVVLVGGVALMAWSVLRRRAA